MMNRPRLVTLLGLSLSLAISGTAMAANSFSANPNKDLRPSGEAPDFLLPPGAASITQSTSQTLTAGSIACTQTGTGFHTENFYYRAFTLSAFNPPLDSVQFMVQQVNFGIEQSTPGPAGTQTMDVRVYDSSANPPTVASLGSVLGSATLTLGPLTLAPASATLAPQPALVNASDILAVELHLPDGRPLSNALFIGSNALGQSGPGFIRAVDCGVSAITTLAAVGFPNMHLVMTVAGNNQVPVELQTFEIR